MARPWQYTFSDPACSVDYWTSHRYAPEVLNSVNQAINYIKVKYKVPSFNLVGFSGGGAIATIIASQRSDILSLRTVAANLDHVALNAYHGVSQMPNSLNAADFARSVQHIPQVHFLGSNDETVPEIIFTSFVRRMTDKGCVKKHILEGAGHTGGWTGRWQRLLAIEPTCPNKTDPALHDAAASLADDLDVLVNEQSQDAQDAAPTSEPILPEPLAEVEPVAEPETVDEAPRVETAPATPEAPAEKPAMEAQIEEPTASPEAAEEESDTMSFEDLEAELERFEKGLEEVTPDAQSAEPVQGAL